MRGSWAVLNAQNDTVLPYYKSLNQKFFVIFSILFLSHIQNSLPLSLKCSSEHSNGNWEKPKIRQPSTVDRRAPRCWPSSEVTKNSRNNLHTHLIPNLKLVSSKSHSNILDLSIKPATSTSKNAHFHRISKPHFHICSHPTPLLLLLETLNPESS